MQNKTQRHRDTENAISFDKKVKRGYLYYNLCASVPLCLYNVLVIVALSIIIAGCTGKEGAKGLITVSPESTVMTLNASLQFSVTPAGTSVTWGVKGDSEKLLGGIDSSGLYKAPSDPATSPEKVIISAIDSSGSKGTATAFLTTFNANKRISKNYAEGAGRSATYSPGQKSIAVFKKDGSGDVNIYMVWADNSPGVSQIWFSKSADNGATFSEPVKVNESPSGKQISPSIAVDNSGKAFVVWEDYRDSDTNILMSFYNGAAFGPILNVNTAFFGSIDRESSPSIALSDSGDICVVWEHRSSSSDLYPDINFSKSTDQGQTFSTPAVVTYSGRRPSIVVDTSGIAYVVWEDLTGFPSTSSPTHIMVSKIKIADTTVGQTIQVDSLPGSFDQARFPSLSVAPDGKKAYVVWQRAEITSPGFEKEITSSYDVDIAVVDVTNYTVTQTLSIPASKNVGFFGGPAYPSIASDNNYVYIVWDDERNGTKDIYFTRSIDGKTFTTTNRIVNDDLGTWHEKPAIAVSDGKAYVIWTDYRNTSLVTTVSPSDVFFARE